MGRFLLYRIPIYRDLKTGNNKSPLFSLSLKNISERVKKELAISISTIMLNNLLW